MAAANRTRAQHFFSFSQRFARQAVATGAPPRACPVHSPRGIVSMARLLRRIGYLIFWLMSAYLAVTLMIALSNQGQPTGELAASNQAPAFYPIWYQDQDLQAAARIGVFVYPLAALSLLLAALASLGHRQRTQADMGMGGLVPVEAGAGAAPPPSQPAPATTPRARGLRAPGTLCTLDPMFVIRSIGADAADLFGLPPTALVGRPILPLVLPQDAARLQQAALAAHAEPGQPVPLLIGLRQPDGTALPTQAECHARTGPEGPQTVLRLLPASERGSLDDQLSAVWY